MPELYKLEKKTCRGWEGTEEGQGEGEMLS